MHTSLPLPPSAIAPGSGAGIAPRTAVIELRVRNHPGAMSHITGLFARRAFNLEAIACAPVGDGATSAMLLLVSDEPRLEQVERQLEKLHDVLAVRHREDIPPRYFGEWIARAGADVHRSDRTPHRGGQDVVHGASGRSAQPPTA